VLVQIVIFKNRIDSSSAKWAVYHKGAFVSQTNPNILYLDATEAEADDTNVLGGSSTTLNSTVFSLGDYNGSNGSGAAMIAYVFAEKKGSQNLVAILVMVMLMEHLFTQDLNQLGLWLKNLVLQEIIGYFR
jgi:hypothetical protein